MKKTLTIVGVVILVLLLGGVWVFRGKRQTIDLTPTPTPEGVLIETVLEERPYVTLTPRVDGREFTLDISRIKNAEIIEYELVYLANGLSRGAVGSVKLKGENEISREVLLGTCSRDVCQYDEGVEEGTLTLRFRGPEGTRKFVSDFHLQSGDKELTSSGGQFKIEGEFSSSAYYITMSTIGLPGEIEGEVVGGPYGIFSSGSGTVKSGKVSLAEDEIKAKVYFWNGKNWIVAPKIVSEIGTFAAVITK